MDQIRTVLTRTAQRGLIDLSQIAASWVSREYHATVRSNTRDALPVWEWDECSDITSYQNGGEIKSAWVYVVCVRARDGCGDTEWMSVHKTRDEAEKAREEMLAAAQAQANGAQTCRACGRPVSCPCGVGIGT